jgi:hypothetical protein
LQSARGAKTSFFLGYLLLIYRSIVFAACKGRVNFQFATKIKQGELS